VQPANIFWGGGRTKWLYLTIKRDFENFGGCPPPDCGPDPCVFVENVDKTDAENGVIL